MEGEETGGLVGVREGGGETNSGTPLASAYWARNSSSEIRTSSSESS